MITMQDALDAGDGTLHASIDHWQERALRAEAGSKAQAREIEALRADAARYRWLRDRNPGGAYRIAGVIYSDGRLGVDTAIDAAMSEAGG